MTETHTQDWKSALNQAQRRAVEHDSGPLIVLAGPGTGKTRVITARLRHLIEKGAEPESLLALTFSVKAAEEMRSRLAISVGARIAERIDASTFHSFAYRLIHRFGDLIGLRSERMIMDSAQTRRLLRSLIGAHGLLRELAPRGPEAAIGVARRFIERLRHAARTSADALAWAEQWGVALEAKQSDGPGDALEAERFEHRLFADCARLMSLYEDACIERGWLSFDDCLALPQRIFTERPIAASIIRQEIRHIVVDEFQDVDRGQIALLRHIAPPRDDAGRAPDLCIVGDDDQGIYGFRGADTHSFSRFATIWPEHTMVTLSVNYRSQRAIVNAANVHIKRSRERFAPDKVIESGPHAGPGSIEGVVLEDDGQAAGVIAALIQHDRAKNADRKYSDYAVLAASNTAAENIAESLIVEGFPVSLRRTATPLDDAGVQDLLAWMSLIVQFGEAGEIASAQRLLIRPPFLVPPAIVSQWAQEFRRSAAIASLDAMEDAAPESTGLFVQWLAQNQAHDAAVKRLVQMLEEFRREAITSPADVVLERIIREAGSTEAEDLSGRARAARIAHLIQALRFARSRQPYLDPPGDLRAFWSYYHDLDAKEQQFVSPNAERLEVDPNDGVTEMFGDEGAQGAIAVMTAHKSKGLEFNTVFLAACRPGGFPATNRKHEEIAAFVLTEFLDEQPRDHGDEQRRLFYVACTRAERRLVMLAKAKKSRGVTDYFIELTEDSPGIEVLQRDASEILESTESGGPSAMDSALAEDMPARRRRDMLIDRAARDARQRAYAALHDAAAVHLTATDLQEISQRLGVAAIELNALETLRVSHALPQELPEQVAQRLQPIAERAAQDVGPERLILPVKGPLELSYSKITDYLKCPRCCYVKYVLRLDERKSAELSAGSIVHKALQWFYEEWRAADAAGTRPPGWERLSALGRKACREELIVSTMTEPGVVATVESLLRNCFERLHDPTANILHIEEKVRFFYPDARDPTMRHRITAKIDRVDQLPSGELRIVDYKSGGAWASLVQPKTNDLQMCIYAMALTCLLDEEGDEQVEFVRSAGHVETVGFAEYWLLQDGVKGVIALNSLSLAKAREEIDKVIEGFLDGKFPRGNERGCKGLCDLLPVEDVEEL